MALMLALVLSIAADARRPVSFDLGFIVREAKCSQQLIPAAKFYDDARITYHMHDGSFVSPAAHEGCCVLDRATGMMELLYSLQKCKAYKAGHVQEHEDWYGMWEQVLHQPALKCVEAGDMVLFTVDFDGEEDVIREPVEATDQLLRKVSIERERERKLTNVNVG